MDDYKGKVRVVWRDLPLPFHPNALPSAIAARAAGEQGKFWEMHDKLFADQAHEDRATFEKYAQELGLNMGKFKAALDAQKGKEAIEADAAAGGKIGAHGTPAFFINGKFLSGAQPYEVFKGKIDEELKIADAMVAKGTPKAKVYDALMKDAKTEVPAAPAAAQAQGAEKTPEQDTTVYKVSRGQRPGQGVEERAAAGGDLLRLPVPVLQARRAAAVAAGEGVRQQGAHGLEELSAALPQLRRAGGRGGHGGQRAGEVLADARQAVREQHRARRPDLEKYAQELGLDMAKFKADLDAQKYKDSIQSDTKEGQAVGVNGTPAVFINGRKINGAYPWETFKKIADDELEEEEGVALASLAAREGLHPSRGPTPGMRRGRVPDLAFPPKSPAGGARLRYTLAQDGSS